VSPPLFLGVVAVDMHMDALEQVLGEDTSTSSKILDRFVMLSTALCPKIELTECELDALRLLGGGGEEAICGFCNSTGYTGIVPEKCPFQSDLPKNVWHNTDMEEIDHGSRACCENEGIAPFNFCPANASEASASSNHQQSDNALIIVLAFAMIIGITLCICVCKRKVVWGERYNDEMSSLTSIDQNTRILELPSDVFVPVRGESGHNRHNDYNEWTEPLINEDILTLIDENTMIIEPPCDIVPGRREYVHYRNNGYDEWSEPLINEGDRNENSSVSPSLRTAELKARLERVSRIRNL